MTNRGCNAKFGPWYVGQGTCADGEVEFIEAVNGGPFRTIAGATKSLKLWVGGKYKKIDIVELVIKRKVTSV